MESSSLYYPKEKNKKQQYFQQLCWNVARRKNVEAIVFPVNKIMMALNITEGVTEKLDLILSKLTSLDSKMEELNLTVNGIQDKVAILETEIAVVQDTTENFHTWVRMQNLWTNKL